MIIKGRSVDVVKKMSRILLTFGVVLMFASPLSVVASGEVTPSDCNGKGSCHPIFDRPF